MCSPLGKRVYESVSLLLLALSSTCPFLGAKISSPLFSLSGSFSFFVLLLRFLPDLEDFWWVGLTSKEGVKVKLECPDIQALGVPFSKRGESSRA